MERYVDKSYGVELNTEKENREEMEQVRGVNAIPIYERSLHLTTAPTPALSSRALRGHYLVAGVNSTPPCTRPESKLHNILKNVDEM